MQRGRKKGEVAGLTKENVTKARAQAFNRINRRVAESRERAKSDRLFREKPLYERIPSLTAQDAIIRETTKQSDQDECKEENSSNETRARGRLMKKRKVNVIEAVANKTHKFTTPFTVGIDIPVVSDTDNTEPKQSDKTKGIIKKGRTTGLSKNGASDKRTSKFKGKSHHNKDKKRTNFPPTNKGLGKSDGRSVVSGSQVMILTTEHEDDKYPTIRTCPSGSQNKATDKSEPENKLPQIAHSVSRSNANLLPEAKGRLSRRSVSTLLLGSDIQRSGKSDVNLPTKGRNQRSGSFTRLPSITPESRLTGDRSTSTFTREKSRTRLPPVGQAEKRPRSKSLGGKKQDIVQAKKDSEVKVIITPPTAGGSLPPTTAIPSPVSEEQGKRTTDTLDALKPVVTSTGLSRFKRAVNVVRFCLRLFPHLISPIPNDYSTEFQKKSVYKDSTGRTLTFDVNYFKKHNKIFCGLSDAAKRALAKDPDDRTELDVTVLQDVIQKWSCLNSYTDPVKRELARLLRFFVTEPHRVILKEGQIGNFIYFVVSGGVRMHYTVVDTKSGSRGILPGREMRPGEFFGEQAIFYHTNRTQTAVSTRTSELLYLRKSDLTAASRTVEERARMNRLKAMENFSCFSGWNEQELLNVANSSTLNTYSDNQVILGKTKGRPKQLYFLNKGRCQVVREVDLKKNPHFESIVNDSKKSKGNRRGKGKESSHFITVGELKSGNFFGVGENMSQNYVLSKGNTECLVVDAVNFERRGHKKDLAKMKEVRESKMPKPRQMLEQYLIRKRWAKFKERLLEDIRMKRKIPNSTRMTDVPKVLRVDPKQ